MHNTTAYCGQCTLHYVTLLRQQRDNAASGALEIIRVRSDEHDRLPDVPRHVDGHWSNIPQRRSGSRCTGHKD
jgi:hypothetical protein